MPDTATPTVSERLAEVTALLGDETARDALTTDELAALRDELRTMGVEIHAGEVEIDDAVQALTDIADHYEGVQFVLDDRKVKADERQAKIDAQAARLAAPEANDSEAAIVVVAGQGTVYDDEEDEDDEDTTPGGMATKPEPKTEPSIAEQIQAGIKAAVEAATTVKDTKPEAAPLPALGNVTPPASHAPATGGAHTESRIMNLRTREFGSIDELVDTFIEERESFLGADDNSSMKIPLGRIKFDIPEDRNLSGVDQQTVDGRLANLLDGAFYADNWNESLVASGGFCAPGEPDYSIPTISGTQRPVAGYLPTVRADRGSKIVVTPPSLANVATTATTTASSAVSVWTNANDISPGSKPVQTVPCPTQQTITLQAIVERLQFGNPMARAFPELVKAWMNNTAAAWARRAEGQLLSQISGFSLALTTAQVLGGTNDFAGYLHQAAAGMRSRQRMPQNARLRVLIPAWFINFVGSDLAHNHPGDGLVRFTQDPEAFVRQIFNAAGVNVTFYEDSTDGGTNQLFSTPTGGADLPNYPPGPASTSARVVWYLFPEGTYARGDAGTLDLGMVRDSTLNNTNDYQIFTESWEAVIPHVIESQKITSTLCPTGQGAIDVTDTAYCTAS